jgi:DUF4097 and DUF4098 domain-containing protein YvlB
MKYKPSKRIYEVMKAYRLLLIIMLMPPANVVPVISMNGQTKPTAAAQQRSEKSINAISDVMVSFEIAAENAPSIMIYGRDQRMVRVEGAASGVELRRRDATGARDAATRIGITIGDFNDHTIDRETRDFGSRAIEVSVPFGASVQLNARDANITIKDVAEVNVQSVQGKIAIERASRVIEASTVTGEISVKDCRGRVRLSSVSGGAEAINTRGTEISDSLKINSVSGDINLEHVAYKQIELEAVSGEITFDGVLSADAQLSARTTSGGISLALPADASFRVLASVILGGFNSDFPLKLTDNSVRKASLRLTGKYGSGDATLDLASHSGSIRIHRRK